MMISLSVSVLWLGMMLAAAIHMQDAPNSRNTCIWVLMAFVGAAFGAVYLSPQPNWVSVLVGIGCLWRLIAGSAPKVGAVFAGASAALAAALHVGAGISPLWAMPLAFSLLLLALAGRRTAAISLQDRRILEYVLMGAALALFIVGLGFDLIFGWHSATMLNRNGLGHSGIPLPPIWAMVGIGCAIMGGLVRGMWGKR